MSWLILTFIFIFFLTGKNLLARIWSQQSQDQRAFAIIFDLFAFSLALIFSTFLQGRLPLPELKAYGIFLLLLNALVYSIADRSIWVAAKNLAASTLSIVIALSSLVYFLFSIYLYQEQILPRHFLGAILMTVAVILVSGKLRAPKHRKGLLFGLLAGLAIGIASSLDKIASQAAGVNFYNYAIWGTTIPFLLFLPPLPVKTLAREWKSIAVEKVALMAFFNVAGFFAFLYALNYGQVFKVLTLAGFITLFTTLGGVFLLKERQDLAKKIAAALIAFLGAVLLI